MDATSIFIIVISVVLAVAFKLFLFKRIRHWMDQDLMKGLADNNPEKLSFLQNKYQQLLTEKVKRKDYHQHLTSFAEEFEQNKT